MTELITLPNGLTVEAPNRGEAAFLYEEIFNGDAYFSTASTCQTAPRCSTSEQTSASSRLRSRSGDAT
jgi:hypothetical protein